jgi:hypothetical protein
LIAWKKNRIQGDLFEERLKRKGEFPSYAEFINATAATDPAIQRFRQNLAKRNIRIQTAQPMIKAKAKKNL